MSHWNIASIHIKYFVRMGAKVEGGEQDLTVLKLDLDAVILLPRPPCVRITGLCHLALALENCCLK